MLFYTKLCVYFLLATMLTGCLDAGFTGDGNNARSRGVQQQPCQCDCNFPFQAAPTIGQFQPVQPAQPVQPQRYVPQPAGDLDSNYQQPLFAPAYVGVPYSYPSGSPQVNTGSPPPQPQQPYFPDNDADYLYYFDY